MTLSDGWIEWKWSPEKTYPETLSTEVEVMHRDGVIGRGCTVDWWHSNHTEMSNWFNTHADNDPDNLDIIAYKLATPSETS